MLVVSADWQGDSWNVGLSGRYLGERYLDAANDSRLPSATVFNAYIGFDLQSLSPKLKGVGANLVPRWFAGLPPVAVAAATLLCGALMALPFAVASWPEVPVSGAAWGSAIAVGVLSTGWAYAMFYRLIQRVGAARAVTVTYLVPLMAVAWAWSLLGEALTWPMAVACALILGSVAVSQRAPLAKA